MAKSKKELDKDLMFAKIMPALSDNPFSDLHGDDDESPSGDSAADAQPQSAAPSAAPSEAEDADDGDLAALRNRLFARGGVLHEEMCTLNLNESIVRRNVDSVIRRFNCCGCDRCRCDVITETLNQVPPHYVTGDSKRIAQYEAEVPEAEIMSALVRAVLQVRAHPKH